MLPNFVKYGMIKSNMDKSFSEKRRQQIIIAWRQITLFGLVTISTLNFTGTNTLEQVQHHTYRIIRKGTRFLAQKFSLKMDMRSGLSRCFWCGGQTCDCPSSDWRRVSKPFFWTSSYFFGFLSDA